MISRKGIEHDVYLASCFPELKGTIVLYPSEIYISRDYSEMDKSYSDNQVASYVADWEVIKSDKTIERIRTCGTMKFKKLRNKEDRRLLDAARQVGYDFATLLVGNE